MVSAKSSRCWETFRHPTDATGYTVILVVTTPEHSPQLQETAVSNGVTLLTIRS